ncbi:MAG: ribosomal protein S18-alanine N-acetyltransferase [Candidatus Zixiibacteriota bacterium]
MSSVSGRSKTDLRIRDMRKADLRAVVELEARVFSDPWPRSAFEEQLSGGGWGALVAEADNRVVGYACYYTVDCEAHLTNIAVEPAYRRKSVARLLLETILHVAEERGCEYVLLEVRVSNAEARAFYEKEGFRLLYRRPYYYRQPAEDALVLGRYLKPNKDST